jgi:hypothetical protein
MTNQEIVHEVAKRVNGTVREDYSGRGMFGKTCMGVVCDEAIEAIEQAASLGLFGAITDNMGKGWIVYWRHVQS